MHSLGVRSPVAMMDGSKRSSSLLQFRAVSLPTFSTGTLDLVTGLAALRSSLVACIVESTFARTFATYVARQCC